MKTAIVTSVIMALAMFAGNRPVTADDHKYAEHLEKYQKHMSEAYQEFSKGDVRDGYKELARAQSEYSKAVWSPPAAYWGPAFGPPAYYGNTYVVYPRHQHHRVYYYRSRYCW